MDKRIPAEVFPPGDFLKEELQVRGWSQGDLAAILGRPIRLVNEIVLGKRAVTPETAIGLAQALGTTPEVWLNLEAAWQLSKLEPNQDVVTRRSKLFSKVPIKEMIRRQWIEDTSNINLLERQVLAFLELRHIDEEPVFAPHAARKSTSYETDTPTQIAWLYRAKQLAKGLNTAPFTQTQFEGSLQKLKLLLHSPEEARHVPRILAEGGVRFLVLEHLSSSRIDGACFWLDSQSPVIAVSLRYDRIDWFWFTLLHECGHIRREDGITDQRPILDIDLVSEKAGADEEKPQNEKVADEFAADFLIPKDRLNDFINRTSPLYQKPKIVGFARTMGVHPGIVVGRLQHEGRLQPERGIGFSSFRETLVHIRQFVTESALTDGWGHIVSIPL